MITNLVLSYRISTSEHLLAGISSSSLWKQRYAFDLNLEYHLSVTSSISLRNFSDMNIFSLIHHNMVGYVIE
jgi:hypothetical protein